MTVNWDLVNHIWRDTIWSCCGKPYDEFRQAHWYGRAWCPFLYDVTCGCGCGTGTAQCPFGYRQRGKW